MEGHVSGLVSGVSSEAVQGDDERCLAVYDFRGQDQDCAVAASGVVYVVDLASGGLGKCSGHLDGVALGLRPPLVLVLGPLLFIGEGGGSLGCGLLKLLNAGVALVKGLAKGRDFGFQRGVLVGERLEGGVPVVGRTCEQGDGQQDAEGQGGKVVVGAPVFCRGGRWA